MKGQGKPGYEGGLEEALYCAKLVVGEEELTTGVPFRVLEEAEGSAVDTNIAGILSVLSRLLLIFWKLWPNRPDIGTLQCCANFRVADL